MSRARRASDERDESSTTERRSAAEEVRAVGWIARAAEARLVCKVINQSNQS